MTGWKATRGAESHVHIGWRGIDKLTLTLSSGMRSGLPALDWNENTFFALTDEATDLATTDPAGTVPHSGIIANNPATGTQTGDGTFKEVSLSHTTQPADITRPGRIGILIHSAGTSRIVREFNQAFFDHVRLHLTRTPDAPPDGR